MITQDEACTRLRTVLDAKANKVSEVSQDGHAWRLYDATQVVTAPDANGRPVTSLRPAAQSIALTLCTTATFRPGKEKAYDGQNDALAYKRDLENEAISLGKIQYRYKDDNYLAEGCRVDRRRELYWVNPADNRVAKVLPEDWILDNFVRVAETYWSIPKTFQLRLLLKGRNDAAFSDEVLRLLEPHDPLTIRFATMFMPNGYNQMYRSNPLQTNNFSTMTSDSTYEHEVGHAFGLDDEYGGKDGKGGGKNDCHASIYAALSPTTYQMCESGASEVRSVYHYIAVSRYVSKQNECGGDSDCGSGEYCDKGTLTVGKNQCVALKADNETCDLVLGGDRQCRSGRCNLGRCFTPGSVAMGGTCYTDGACRNGKCSAVDGTRGSCVCNADSQCGSGSFCNAGLDLAHNSCQALKDDNEICDIAGGGHQCKSGRCNLGRCYTPASVGAGGTCYNDAACQTGKCSAIDGTRGSCVCKVDQDCGAGQWCDAGLDTKLNVCRGKLDAGQSCGKAGSVGNDHKCKSGECSGFPKYQCQ